MCTLSTPFKSTRVHNGAVAAATSQSALTNWVKIFHLAPNWSVLGIFHFHFIFWLRAMSSASCFFMKLSLSPQGMKTLKKLQCLHIDDDFYPLAWMMLLSSPWCVLYAYNFTFFNSLPFTQLQSHNLHMHASRSPHFTYRVLIHVTPQHRYFQLNYWKSIWNLCSKMQCMERNKSSKWTILKYISTTSAAAPTYITIIKWIFNFIRTNRVDLSRWRGGDYEIEFRFISWIFNNKIWCMHISHSHWCF